jgi:hypothetical protein
MRPDRSPVRSAGVPRYDAAPDLILHNARINVVDAEGSLVEALAIKEDRIVAIGSTAEVRRLAAPRTRQIDLAGRTVIPGFVDGHPHMDTVALKLTRPSFEGARSIDDVLDVVAKAVAARAAGERIVCNPLAEEPEVFRMPGALREGRWPTRHDLDRVAPQHPVVIQSPILVAPGIAIANTAALVAAGIGRDTAAPEGVEVDRDAQGEPTGIFRDFTFPKRQGGQNALRKTPDGYLGDPAAASPDAGLRALEEEADAIAGAMVRTLQSGPGGRPRDRS